MPLAFLLCLRQRISSFLSSPRWQILEILATSKPNSTPEQRQAIAEAVSLAAIKYALLKNNVGEDVIFNISESVSFEGNSGPYLLYTYARGKSVLRKAGTNENQIPDQVRNDDIKISPAEKAILSHLAKYDEVVNQAIDMLAPHLICTYLYQLASLFNSFYNTHRIPNAENAWLLHLRH